MKTCDKCEKLKTKNKSLRSDIQWLTREYRELEKEYNAIRNWAEKGKKMAEEIMSKR